MANMSYCRFQNTLSAFKDCYAELEEAEFGFNEMNLSPDESQAMYQLANYARKFLDRFQELQELAEYEFARTMDDGA
jgi:hypothetical protein